MPGIYPGMPITPGMGAGGGRSPFGPQQPSRAGVMNAQWYGNPYDQARVEDAYRQRMEDYNRALALRQMQAQARYRPVGGRGYPDPSAYLPQLMGLMFGGGGGGRRGFGDF